MNIFSYAYQNIFFFWISAEEYRHEFFYFCLLFHWRRTLHLKARPEIFYLPGNYGQIIRKIYLTYQRPGYRWIGFLSFIGKTNRTAELCSPHPQGNSHDLLKVRKTIEGGVVHRPIKEHFFVHFFRMDFPYYTKIPPPQRTLRELCGNRVFFMNFLSLTRCGRPSWRWFCS